MFPTTASLFVFWYFLIAIFLFFLLIPSHLPLEHRPSSTSHRAFLSVATSFSSFLIVLISFLSLSLILSWCVFKRPNLLLCGSLWKSYLVMLLGGLLNVCPIQRQHHFLTCWFTEICLVLSLSSTLVSLLQINEHRVRFFMLLCLVCQHQNFVCVRSI